MKEHKPHLTPEQRATFESLAFLTYKTPGLSIDEQKKPTEMWLRNPPGCPHE